MYKKIIEMITEYEEESDFYGKVSEEDIEYVECILNMKFPDDYRWFVRNYGSGGICGVEVLGVEKKEKSSVVEATKRYRELGLDSNYIVIEDLGEFILCIDKSNENKIIRWDRVSKISEYRHNSFCDYLIDTFQEAIDNWD